MTGAQWRAAFALAFGTAVSLGLARFSYALVLPPMRADLGWSYLVSGAMNTVNAGGYFAGALLTGRWLRTHPARRVLVAGSAATGAFLFAHGLVVSDAALYVFRFLTGLASAASLIAGAVLAARLATAVASHGARSGLVLGIYYAGTGIGVIASALMTPPLLASAATHAWQAPWLGIGVAALVAAALIALGTRDVDDARSNATARTPFAWRPFAFGLAAYFLFGLGYIGYMTFSITLLREMHWSTGLVTAYFVALGVAVCASPWLWSWLLQGYRGGEPLTVLNALLAVATILPVASDGLASVFASGILFGAALLALVASTTALVRHNLPTDAWPAGIAVFTTVFATGQIVGPVLVGWVSDASGGLAGGFACCAVVLALASLLAWSQKPLRRA